MINAQYLTAHLRRVVRESVAPCTTSTAGDSVMTSPVTSPAAPPGGQDSKQVFYAKYCLRHIATPRARTRKLPPSNVEIEVLFVVASASVNPLTHTVAIWVQL